MQINDLLLNQKHQRRLLKSQQVQGYDDLLRNSSRPNFGLEGTSLLVSSGSINLIHDSKATGQTFGI